MLVVAGATEETLSELLENAPCGFLSLADDGTVAYVNTTLLERLRFAREDVAGHHVETLFGVGTRIFYQTHFFPLVKLQGRAQEIFLLLRTSNGEDVGMLCNAVRHQRNGADVTDCVFMEVQERRRFEEALVQAKQTAERAIIELEARNREAEHTARDLKRLREVADDANHAKSNFLAVMSHELRTPLNAIGGYVQLLEMGVHGPITNAQQEALGRIDRSQRHLLRLINDVLNLSRIEAGRVDYRVESVSVSEVVATTLPMVDPQLAAKSLRLAQAVPSDVRARADRDKVQQILLNLLTNAVKFTAAEGEIRVEANTLSPSLVSLRVTDTGLGIPAEMLEKVFEPFIQVDESRSRQGEGTGLGLAISRDLARGMGGDLTAESTLGVGSTFQLTLPRE